MQCFVRDFAKKKDILRTPYGRYANIQIGCNPYKHK